MTLTCVICCGHVDLQRLFATMTYVVHFFHAGVQSSGDPTGSRSYTWRAAELNRPQPWTSGCEMEQRTVADAVAPQPQMQPLSFLRVVVQSCLQPECITPVMMLGVTAVPLCVMLLRLGVLCNAGRGGGWGVG